MPIKVTFRIILLFPLHQLHDKERALELCKFNSKLLVNFMSSLLRLFKEIVDKQQENKRIHKLTIESSFSSSPCRSLKRDQPEVEQVAAKMRQLQSGLWAHLPRSGAPQRLHNGRVAGSFLLDVISGRQQQSPLWPPAPPSALAARLSPSAASQLQQQWRRRISVRVHGRGAPAFAQGCHLLPTAAATQFQATQSLLHGSERF